MRGVGALLHDLTGGTEENASKYYGRKIIGARFSNDTMAISFEGGASIEITDEGQSCCENRYMTCDDKPEELIGQTLKHIVVKGSEEKSVDYDTHEICFLEIQGDESAITFATHNLHNGYCGGFGLNIRETASSVVEETERK